MKTPSAVAILILSALGAVAEAGSLPRPISPVQRQKGDAHLNHYVRADKKPKLPKPIRITVDQPVPFHQTHYVRGN